MKKVSHLEAVTVCVGYSDYLQETAKFNAGLFSRWIIVTTPDDEKTRWVCNRFNLETILCEDGKRHTRNGDGFNKGRLIERGLQQTSDEGWRLHIDCDIVLPHRFQHLMEIADLQQDTIYGADRAMIHSFEEWKKLVATGYMQGGGWDYHCRTTFPQGFEIGTRWTHPHFGYVPIGFFQLYHSSQDEWRGIRVKHYPMNHSGACRTDCQFGLKWDRHKRNLMPELIVVHLDSERLAKGANWKGRVTKQFGPGVQCGPNYFHGGSGS